MLVFCQFVKLVIHQEQKYCDNMLKKVTLKQIFYVAVIIGMAYIGVRPVTLHGEFIENIKKVKCKNVWGYMADFR